jgi:hypothetical protein
VPPQAALRLLAWLFYAMGGLMTFAFLAVVMPTTWSGSRGAHANLSLEPKGPEQEPLILRRIWGSTR